MSLNKWKRFRFSNRQQGFTLLEVLIAIFVLSIGMLGLAALQLNAQQNAHYSYQATIANLAAKDAKERLWADLIDNEDRVCPGNGRLEDVESAWKESWMAGDNDGKLGKLPDITVSISNPLDCEYVLTVKWRNDRSGVEKNLEGEDVGSRVTRFNYYMRLPGLSVAAGS